MNNPVYSCITKSKQMEEEDYVIAEWALEDVETLYNLVNK
jgi:hypothetical protein